MKDLGNGAFEHTKKSVENVVRRPNLPLRQALLALLAAGSVAATDISHAGETSSDQRDWGQGLRAAQFSHNNKTANEAVRHEFKLARQAVGVGLLEEDAKLTHGDFNDVLELMAAYSLNAPWSALRGTPLDADAVDNHVVLLSRHTKGPVRISKMQTAADAAILADANQGILTYGQGIPVSGDTVLTNKHVAELLYPGASSVYVRAHPSYDLAFVQVPHQHFTRTEQVHVPIPLANEDVHGAFVVLSGINPNWTSTHMDTNASAIVGRKAYGNVAIKIPETLMPFLVDGGILTSQAKAHLRNGFLVQIPNIESLGEQGQEIPIEQAALRGSSGSPVFVLRGNDYVFCGVVERVLRIPGPNNTTLTFAVFIGPEAINEATKSLN